MVLRACANISQRNEKIVATATVSDDQHGRRYTRLLKYVLVWTWTVAVAGTVWMCSMLSVGAVVLLWEISDNPGMSITAASDDEVAERAVHRQEPPPGASASDLLEERPVGQ